MAEETPIHDADAHDGMTLTADAAGPDIIEFTARAPSSALLGAFMILHAISLTLVVFGGLIGFTGASARDEMAMAALAALGLSIPIALAIEWTRRRNARRFTGPLLRLSPDGLDGQAFRRRGLGLVPWGGFRMAKVDGDAVEVRFAPLNPGSAQPADRIGAIRIAPAANASAQDIAAALHAYAARVAQSA